MPRNKDIPKPKIKIIKKSKLLKSLLAIDINSSARKRVLDLETEFRKRINLHVDSLPEASSSFQKFNTNPFVIMFYAKQKRYSFVSEIENDILPAKLFSSMETSAGRMVQDVVLPIYGWEYVESSMHSASSVIDGRKMTDDSLFLTTIKSGPRCLNDEMSKDLAEDIVAHAGEWAKESGRDHIVFSYGVLYGTKKLSNKKDWHILRNIVEIKGQKFIKDHPAKKWYCSFMNKGTQVDVFIKIGEDWWSSIGNELRLVEVLISLIRACVTPSNKIPKTKKFMISDLEEIISIKNVPQNFNVSLLQKSQIEWLFFMARHYCDKLEE